MPFHFQFASLLALREAMERREWLAVQAINRQLVAARLELATLEQIRCERMKEQREQLAQGVTASRLHFDEACGKTLEDARNTIEVKITVLEGEFTKRREAYDCERQKREVLTNLRDRQREQYACEEARREQARADELFLMRRLCGKG